MKMKLISSLWMYIAVPITIIGTLLFDSLDSKEIPDKNIKYKFYILLSSGTSQSHIYCDSVKMVNSHSARLWIDGATNDVKVTEYEGKILVQSNY